MIIKNLRNRKKSSDDLLHNGFFESLDRGLLALIIIIFENLLHKSTVSIVFPFKTVNYSILSQKCTEFKIRYHLFTAKFFHNTVIVMNFLLKT